MAKRLSDKIALRFVPCRPQGGCDTRGVRRVNSDAHVVEFTIKIISRLRARKPSAHLIPFDFFAADGVFGGTVGDDAAAEFFAQGVHCGFDGFLLFLLCVVRAEQVELAVGLRFFGQMQCRDGEEPDRVGWLSTSPLQGGARYR